MFVAIFLPWLLPGASAIRVTRTCRGFVHLFSALRSSGSVTLRSPLALSGALAGPTGFPCGADPRWPARTNAKGAVQLRLVVAHPERKLSKVRLFAAVSIAWIAFKIMICITLLETIIAIFLLAWTRPVASSVAVCAWRKKQGLLRQS